MWSLENLKLYVYYNYIYALYYTEMLEMKLFYSVYLNHSSFWFITIYHFVVHLSMSEHDEAVKMQLPPPPPPQKKSP